MVEEKAVQMTEVDWMEVVRLAAAPVMVEQMLVVAKQVVVLVVVKQVAGLGEAKQAVVKQVAVLGEANQLAVLVEVK